MLVAGIWVLVGGVGGQLGGVCLHYIKQIINAFTVIQCNKSKIQENLVGLVKKTDESASRAYLRGGGVQTPPPKIFRFFLKSEGKEIERKRKKGMLEGGGGYLLTYFWG